MNLFKPNYEKEHEFEWYFTDKAAKTYNGLSVIRIYEKEKFLYNFIKSLPNSKNFIRDWRHFAEAMLWLESCVKTDKWGNETFPSWNGYENVINRDKNPFLDFLLKLKHSLYGNRTLINVIITCCLSGVFNLDEEDKWIVDDHDFWNNEDENGIFTKFMDRLISENPNLEIEPSNIISVLK